MPLRVEVNVHPPDQPADWWLFTKLTAADGEDSLPDNTLEGRDIYTFGVHQADNEAEDYAYINKTETGRGIDPDTVARPLGAIAVAKLLDTESFILKIQTDTYPGPHAIRFTYLSERHSQRQFQRGWTGRWWTSIFHRSIT